MHGTPCLFFFCFVLNLCDDCISHGYCKIFKRRNIETSSMLLEHNSFNIFQSVFVCDSIEKIMNMIEVEDN